MKFSWILGDDGNLYAEQGDKILRDLVVPLLSRGGDNIYASQTSSSDINEWEFGSWLIRQVSQRTSVTVRPLLGGTYVTITATRYPQCPWIVRGEAHPGDDWSEIVVDRVSALRRIEKEAGTYVDRIERRPDGTLYADLTPDESATDARYVVMAYPVNE